MTTQKVYPRWKFHKVEGAKIVQSANEDRKLGAQWMETYIAQNVMDVAKAQLRAEEFMNAFVEEPKPEKEEKPEKPEKPKGKRKEAGS